MGFCGACGALVTVYLYLFIGVVCGDWIVAPSETCDDGNTNNGDGCSSTCLVENGWACGGDPNVSYYVHIDQGS